MHVGWLWERGKAWTRVDSGHASGTALNFQDGFASTLPVAPLCFVPSTLWVTVTPVLQLQPNTGFLFSPVPSHWDHCRLAQGPFQGKGVAKGRVTHIPSWKRLRG